VTDTLAPSPFQQAVAYYDRFRAPYAPAALDYVVEALALGPGDRVLDLGCGPGTLAIPLSRRVGEVVAVDPAAGMLAEGERLAAQREAGTIRWLHSRAEDLPPDLGRFKLAVMGQSAHWMDRDGVLSRLGDLIEPGGALAIFDEGQRRPQESWERTAAMVAGRFLGRPPRHPGKHPEVAHAPSLQRSAHFSAFTVREFPHQLVRDVASVLGCCYSGVGASRLALGEQADVFEAELADALYALSPSGVFEESLETAVILAFRADHPPVASAAAPR
jgi:ubiquinone/menaquinone biosynthesis C-methylase UbiE